MTLRRLAVLLAATVGIGAGAGFAATLTVGSWHLWAGSQTLTKGSCTVTGSPSASDTYVSQSSPNSNFGTTTTMLAKPSNSQDWAFVRFDLSGCSIPTSGGADSATLNLTITTAPNQSRTLTVTPVLTTWDSSTLTWNGAQSLSYGSATTTFTTGTTNNVTVSIPVTVDVDALIKNTSANYGWRISDGGGNGGATTTFATLEAASNHPQLVINYEK